MIIINVLILYSIFNIDVFASDVQEAGMIASKSKIFLSELHSINSKKIFPNPSEKYLIDCPDDNELLYDADLISACETLPDFIPTCSSITFLTYSSITDIYINKLEADYHPVSSFVTMPMIDCSNGYHPVSSFVTMPMIDYSNGYHPVSSFITMPMIDYNEKIILPKKREAYDNFGTPALLHKKLRGQS
jgi:hypothetical protein